MDQRHINLCLLLLTMMLTHTSFGQFGPESPYGLRMIHNAISKNNTNNKMANDVKSILESYARGEESEFNPLHSILSPAFRNMSTVINNSKTIKKEVRSEKNSTQCIMDIYRLFTGLKSPTEAAWAIQCK